MNLPAGKQWHWVWVALAWASSGTAAEFPQFRPVVIDPDIGKVCYAVDLADVDGDGKLDIVAVSENRVQWYQAPDWRKRIILEDQTELDNVCIAPADIDGDGRIDFALGAGWTKIGTLQWLSRGGSLEEKWHVHAIDREPWLHRLRFADVLGTGKPQLVISPLNKTTGGGVRLTAFEIPAHPKTDRWPRTLLDDTLDRMHNHWQVDWDGDGTIDTIVACQQGVFLVHRDKGGWKKTQLGSGAPGTQPADQGAGEVKVGRLRNGGKFLATIEPMHGNIVAVYTEPRGAGPLWERHVLEENLRQGHAVWTANLDDDPEEELIIGHREAGTGPVKGPGLYVFDAANEQGTQWDKHVLDDGGVAVEDAVAADLTGDGRVDIVAGGRATRNVLLYVNQGR